MAMTTIGKASVRFRQMAVERMKRATTSSRFQRTWGSIDGCCIKLARSIEPIEGRQGHAGKSKERESALRKVEPPTKAAGGGENAGSGFFQRCLAKSRGSTPEQRRPGATASTTKSGELMSMQGNLSIERMCQLAQVSRAGFYRSLAGAEAGGRRDGSAVGDSADRR